MNNLELLDHAIHKFGKDKEYSFYFSVSTIVITIRDSNAQFIGQMWLSNGEIKSTIK
jgi:hypothetical protein